MMQKFFLNTSLCLLFLFTFDLHALKALKGDQDNPPPTFSFSLGTHASSGRGNLFVVGARDAIQEPKNFALARYMQEGGDLFIPLTPEKVTLNGQSDQPNPLYNQAITLLGLFSVQDGAFSLSVDQVFAVPENNQTSVFLIERLTNDGAVMRSADDLKDTSGTDVTNGIVATAGAAGNGVFAAVKGNGQANFGPVTSGIAVIALRDFKPQEGEDTGMKRMFMQIDAQAGNPPVEGATRAAALDVTSTYLAINNDLASIGDAVDMWWDAYLQRLYIALQVQAGGAAGDGARAIAVGRMNGPVLTLDEIVDAAVFDGALDKIVGASGANEQVALHKVRTMYTSTRLSYLIVVGGNGGAATTQNLVFALPLVCNYNANNMIADQATHGRIANKNEDPTTIFIGQNNFLSKRCLTEPAATPAQMTTATDVPAMVGCGQLDAGDITDIIVRGDTVYVSVGDPAVDQKSGIFYSQALMDDQGKIKGWTAWQRVGGTTDPVFGISINPATGDTLFMTGNDANSVDTVYRTQWGKGDEDLSAQLVGGLSAITKDNAGVQGLFDFKPDTPGLDELSLLISTGLNTVVLAESGQVDGNGVLCPNVGDFSTNAQHFTDGSVQNAIPGNARIVSFTGGVLTTLGPIVAAEFAQDNNDGFLFVGGIGGLAVLVDANGDGFVGGLGQNFANMVPGMAFKLLGSYSFVRKIMFDDGFVYVLTNKKLDRIDLANSDLMAGTLDVTTVATIDTIAGVGANGTLLDFVVSEKFAVLGTSAGLYRVGNGANIRTAANETAVAWTNVFLGEAQTSIQVVTDTIATTKTCRAQDLARQDAGGQLYALAGYIGKDRASLIRYCVQSVVGNQIDETTMMPVPDVIVMGVLSGYARFKDFRNEFITDGAVSLRSRDRDLCEVPFVETASLPIPLSLTDASNIVRLLRSKAAGNWYVATDCGLFINE